MKKSTRLLSLLACLVMLIAMLSVTAYAADEVASGTCGINVNWTLNSTGLLTISGSGRMYDYSNYGPWSSAGTVKAVVVEEGITYIGMKAFKDCDALTTITLPSTVTVIEGNAFLNCSALTDVYCQHEFQWNNIKGGNSTLIGANIHYEACSERISKNGICDICTYEYPVIDFGTCGENLNWFKYEDGLLYITGTGAMDNYENDFSHGTTTAPWFSSMIREMVKKVKIDSGVTSIGDYAFYSFDYLTEVIIPETVTHIGNGAFEYCFNITKISLPDNVTTIGDHAFFAAGLTEIAIPKQLSSIGDHTFASCNFSEVTIPESVTAIGSHAFYSCDNLTKVTMSNNVTTIDEHAFSYCDKLTDITLSCGLTTVAESTFFNCGSLTSIAIPNGISSIKEDAFGFCDSLTEIFLPATLTDIHVSAFRNDALKDIYFAGNEEQWRKLDITVSNCFGLDEVSLHLNAVCTNNAQHSYSEGICTVCGAAAPVKLIDHGHESNYFQWYYYENGLLSVSGDGDMYTFRYSKPGWLTYKDVITTVNLSENITTISDCAFEELSNLKEIVLPAGITAIEYNAFSSCNNLTQIAIPDGVTTIEWSAFIYCRSLTDVYYGGTEAEWNTIAIGADNTYLTNATIHYEACIYTGKHTFSDGTCTVCGEAQPFEFYGTNMTLGNALDLNFAIETILVPDGAYAIVTRTYADGKEADVKTINKENWTAQNTDGTELYLITYSGLAAKEMCDTVKVEVYNSNNELLGSKEDSIQSYALRCITDEGDTYTKEAKTLLIKMLDYGAAAQEQFTYNTADPANKEITEDIRNAYPFIARDVPNYNPAIGDLYMGTSLVLENNIEMQMGFTGIDDSVTAWVSYRHYNEASALPYELTSKDFYKYNDTTYGVIIPNIIVADARQDVTVTLYKGDEVLISVTDSISSYVARNGRSGVYGAIMDFSDAALAYFRSLETT